MGGAKLPGQPYKFAKGGKLQDGRNVPEINTSQIGFHAFHGPSHQAARGGQRQGHQGVRAHADGAWAYGEVFRGQAVDLGFPVCFFRQRPIGRVGQGLLDGRIPNGPELRQTGTFFLKIE